MYGQGNSSHGRSGSFQNIQVPYSTSSFGHEFRPLMRSMAQTQYQRELHFHGATSASLSAVSTTQFQAQGQSLTQLEDQASHNDLLVQEAEALYKIEMAGFLRAVDDETKLIQVEMAVRQNVFLGMQSKAKNVSFSWESLKNLQQTLTHWFLNRLVVFRTKLERDRGLALIRNIIIKIAPAYHETMQSFLRVVECTEPSKLFQIHQRISEQLLQFLISNPNQPTNFQQHANLTWSQNNEYTAEMLNLFKSYDESNRKKYDEKSIAIGIHFGTTHIRAAICVQGKVNLIKSKNGKTTMPNFVSFVDTDHILVGEEAEQHFYQSPNHTAVFGIKQIIGKRFEEVMSSEDPMKNCWPFQIIRGEVDCPPKIQVEVLQQAPGNPLDQCNTGSGKIENYYPEEILAMILQHVKRTAEQFLGAPIKSAVISVPSHFTDGQRQAVRDAGEISGIKVLKLINSTTAAALAYHEVTTKPRSMAMNMHAATEAGNTTATHEEQEMDSGDKKTALVFQLGAGELEVSIAEIRKGHVNIIASGSDPDVKGQDFDHQMTNFIVDSFKQSHQIELDRGLKSKNSQEKLLAIKRLMKMRNEVEKHKRILSSSSESSISFPQLEAEYSNLNLQFKITGKMMEHVNQGKFSRCVKLVQWILEDAKLDKSQIDKVILAGGTTQIPQLRKWLFDFFGSDREHILRTEMIENPEDLAVIGAASYACMMREQVNCGTNPVVKIVDVLTYSILGQRQYKETGSTSCIENPQNTAVIHIPRNFPLPCVGGSKWPVLKDSIFSQDHDELRTLSIRIFEGGKYSGLHVLGECRIRDIPTESISQQDTEPSGVTMTMKVNEDGILDATASCDSNSKLPTFLNKERMTPNEIEKAKRKLSFLVQIRGSQNRSYRCNKCDKNFSSPAALNAHQRFMHMNFKCRHPSCTFTCVHTFNLMVHMRKHATGQNEKAPTSVPVLVRSVSSTFTPEFPPSVSWSSAAATQNQTTRKSTDANAEPCALRRF